MPKTLTILTIPGRFTYTVDATHEGEMVVFNFAAPLVPASKDSAFHEWDTLVAFARAVVAEEDDPKSLFKPGSR